MIIGKSDLQEIKYKTVDELIKVIENAKPRAFSDKLLVLNGNYLDVCDLIIKFQLRKHVFWHYDGKHFSFPYSKFKHVEICTDTKDKNTFATGPSSTYGHLITKLNINNIHVEVRQNPKTNYEHTYKSHRLQSYDNNKFVVLDIETTGLDPLIDDIIQLGIYESDGNSYSRYLPLRKSKTNAAKDINRISDEQLKDLEDLSQAEVDGIIKQFDLDNTIVMIWSGSNYFDRTFLEIYFKEHNLEGLNHFTFYNAKNFVDDIKYEISITDFSKDNLARIYGITYGESHDALVDCKIEKEVINNLLAKNIEPLKIEEFNETIRSIVVYFSVFFDTLMNYNVNHPRYDGLYAAVKSKAYKLYENLCEKLKYKYGEVDKDYDKNPRTRGSEWIDIHHIDEFQVDDIAVRTQNAINNRDVEVLDILADYNKRDRLVYANKVEHFILHALLDFVRGIESGGPHYTFGAIVKLETGIFAEESKFFRLQKQKDKFFQVISFERIVDIYVTICAYWGIKDLTPYIDKFWKITEYNYDKNVQLSIMEMIGTKLSNYYDNRKGVRHKKSINNG